MKYLIVSILLCATYACAMEAPFEYEIQEKATVLLGRAITMANKQEKSLVTRQNDIRLFTKGLELIRSYQETNNELELLLKNSQFMTQEEITFHWQLAQQQYANACTTMINLAQNYITKNNIKE